MKKSKESKKNLPQVHILGDLKDVKNLVSAVNKKRSLVLFHNGDQDSFYLEIEDKIRKIHQKQIARLEKDYKLIIFSFFPSRKKDELLTEEESVVKELDKPEIEVQKKGKKKKKLLIEKMP